MWIRRYIMHYSGWLSEFSPLTWMLLTICAAAVIPGLIKRWKLVSALERLPGPVALPLLGNALLFRSGPRAIFNTMVHMCCYEEGITRFWLGFDPNVFIYRSDLVEKILRSSKHMEKSWGYRFLQPWVGLGLLTSTGSKWQSRRKLLNPTFHLKLLEDFVEVFNHQSMKLVHKLNKETNGKPFNIYPFISRCTLDILCETGMGVNPNAQDETESKYLQSVAKMSNLIQHRIARPWLHPDFLYRILGPYHEFDQALTVLHGFTKGVIKQRKQERIQMRENMNDRKPAEMHRKRLAFLDLLLEYSENSSHLSDEDIREEVDTFFGGQNTITASINWTLYLLGLHPDIQALVHRELDDVFADSNRPVTSDDLCQLKYLECCIKESLRLYPGVPLISRNLKEDLQLDQHIIPGGTTLIVMIFQLHRDPKYFPDPEVFLPERFAPENANGRHPYAYIPFSAGPRNCIGQKYSMMKEKIVLCNILRHFTIESQVPREDLCIIGEIILKPENGNILKISPKKRITYHKE